MDTDEPTDLEKRKMVMTAVQIVNIKEKKFIIYGVDITTLSEKEQESILNAEKESIAEQEKLAKKRKV